MSDSFTARGKGWYCDNCDVNNSIHRRECRNCGREKAMKSEPSGPSRGLKRSRSPQDDLYATPAKSARTAVVDNANGDWICQNCNESNFRSRRFCRKCERQSERTSGGGRSRERRQEWTCDGCGASNFLERRRCRRCNCPGSGETARPQWSCPACQTNNWMERKTCRSCSANAGPPPVEPQLPEFDLLMQKRLKDSAAGAWSVLSATSGILVRWTTAIDAGRGRPRVSIALWTLPGVEMSLSQAVSGVKIETLISNESKMVRSSTSSARSKSGPRMVPEIESGRKSRFSRRVTRRNRNQILDQSLA